MSTSTRAASPTSAAKVELRPSPAASPSLKSKSSGGRPGGPSVGRAVVGDEVGLSVTGTQVCPIDEQSPSEQRWVLAQLQRYAAGEDRSREPMPNSVESQPWVPCWVGAEVVGA